METHQLRVDVFGLYAPQESTQAGQGARGLPLFMMFNGLLFLVLPEAVLRRVGLVINQEERFFIKSTFADVQTTSV